MMRGVRKRGNKYFIDFYSNGQRVREVVGTSQKQAEDALRKRKTEVIEGKFFDKRKEQRIRFADEADEYYKMHSEVDLKPTSRDRDFTLLKNLKAYFGNQYLHTITAKDIEAYKKKRIEDKVTGATVNRELSCLRSLYNRAIAGKKIIDSPMKTVKMFPEPKGRLRFLEKEEIPKLLNACSEHLRPIVITALFTGMRRSEVLGLRWRDAGYRYKEKSYISV